MTPLAGPRCPGVGTEEATVFIPLDTFARRLAESRALHREERRPQEHIDATLPRVARIADLYARRLNTGRVRANRRCPALR